MKISIIVPVYNTNGKYLFCLFDTLQHLDKDRFQILIIDDFSSNKKTLGVLNKFNDVINFRIIRNKTNKGVSFCRNLGINVSSHQYICFVDSDDLVDYHVLNKVSMLGELTDITIFGREYINNRTTNINTYDCCLQIFENNYPFIDIISNNSISKLFSGFALRGVRCKIFNKNFLVRNNIYFDEHLRQYEDTIFLSKVSLHNPTLTIYKNKCDYCRLNPRSLSHSYNSNFNNNFAYFCSLFKSLFSDNDKLLEMFYSSLYNTYLPIRSWVSFKRIRWIDGLKFLKLDFFVNDCTKKTYYNEKVYMYYKKRKFLNLYFKMNFAHIFAVLKKR